MVIRKLDHDLSSRFEFRLGPRYCRRIGHVTSPPKNDLPQRARTRARVSPGHFGKRTACCPCIFWKVPRSARGPWAVFHDFLVRSTRNVFNARSILATVGMLGLFL